MSNIVSILGDILEWIRDPRIVLIILTLIIVLGLYRIYNKLLKERISFLKDQIADLDKKQAGLEENQINHALRTIKTLEEFFRVEKSQLEREIGSLRERGEERDEELSAVKKILSNVQNKLDRIAKDKESITNQIDKILTLGGKNPQRKNFDQETLRKLRVWCDSELYGSPNSIIPDYLFGSSTYGEVGVSQIEQHIMLKMGWIEEVDNGVRITEKGRQAAAGNLVSE